MLIRQPTSRGLIRDERACVYVFMCVSVLQCAGATRVCVVPIRLSGAGSVDVGQAPC